ncbi:MAG: DUF3794 domain-containing protein, partial [Candidatus Scatosoma sp.]
MIKPEYATYRCTKKACNATAQSKVECRVSGSEISEILAVRAEAYPALCTCGDKQVDYGGKALFTIVYVDGEKRICRAERGVEFSHRIPCEEAFEECFASLVCKVDDVSYRREGSNIIVAAVVRADADIYREDEFTYLTGGENLAVKKEGCLFTRVSLTNVDGEENDEFETEYFTDVLLHSETAYIKNVSCENGTAKAEGEIALNVCVLKGDDLPASYERLIPFCVETPAPYFCDENWQNQNASALDTAEKTETANAAAKNKTEGVEAKIFARVTLKSANLSVETSEEKNKSAVRAQLAFSVQIAQYTPERIDFCADAFSTKQQVLLRKEQTTYRRLKGMKTYVKKAEGIAALNAPIDYTASFLAAAVPKAEISVKKADDNAIELEGAATARVILSDKDGVRAAEMTLPFLFNETCDSSLLSGEQTFEAEAVVCGISMRQKKEGEAEAEATVKITVYFYETVPVSYVAAAEEGEEYGEEKCAMSVFLPRAGDGLWETAKALRKTPEELQR